MQELNLAQYDGLVIDHTHPHPPPHPHPNVNLTITGAPSLALLPRLIAVGGDGLFNELLNGLLLQTQHNAGVNLRKARFVPVTAHTRIGIIPMGACNSLARSVLGCQDPFIAAAQIMLGEEGVVCGGGCGIWRRARSVEEDVVCGGGRGLWRRAWSVEEGVVWCDVIHRRWSGTFHT